MTKNLSLTKLYTGSSEHSSQLGLDLVMFMSAFASLNFNKNPTKLV